MVIFLIASIIWPVVYRKDMDHRSTHAVLFFLAALPAAGIVAAHAYSWWTGTHGSAGLTRVLVTTVPLAALFTLFTLGRAIGILPAMRWSGPLMCATIMTTSVLAFRASGSLRQEPSEEQVILHDVCDLITEARDPGDRVFTTHPYIPFRLGLDGFDPEEARMLWGFEGMEDNVPSRPRDLVFWESAMGPTQCGVELERFIDDTAFTVLGLRLPKHGHMVSEGHAYELWAFQRQPSKRYVIRDTLGTDSGALAPYRPRLDTIARTPGAVWCARHEFPWTLEQLPAPVSPAIYDLWSVEIDVDFPTAGSDVSFVLKRTQGEELLRYDERWLRQGPNGFSFRVPDEGGTGDLTMYIYAPDHREIRCRSMRLIRERVLQERRISPITR